MPIHVLKLVNRREVADHTVEFQFEKPATLTFTPGQYAGFTLINPRETDAGGITRRFSLLSTPHDPYLAIAVRIQSSAYKRMLNELRVGDEIKFAGPTGNFVCHTDASVPAVFIAGGIGITPFYSILRHASQQQQTQPMTLFYGNQAPKDAAFFDELTQLQTTHAPFTFVPTFAMPDADWQGETGYITHTLLKKHIPDIQQPIYYVCGSPAMVTVLQETLAEMGINEDNIKVEDFPGY